MRNPDGYVEPLASLLEERQYLLDIAYGYLGSWSAAEDALLETYAIWYAMKECDIWSHRVWLRNKMTAICRVRAGLPDEESLDDALRMPEATARQDKTSVTLAENAREAVQEALDALTPQERSALLGEEPAMHCRATTDDMGGTSLSAETVARIARQSLVGAYPGPATTEERLRVARAFHRACTNGDVNLLGSLMSPEVSAVFDGGGRVRTPERPVTGADDVTRCLATFLTPDPAVSLTGQGINGQPGIVVHHGRVVVAVISLDLRADKLINIWVVVNPDKLQRWNRD
ncbi:hypothetical protein ACIQ64_24830 [Streptomyces sp. NPDC094473]|uniref:hypothetical protein n=1 Tax=unclassified Streptomyces TaxID=2593676 RepID=UPI002E2A350E|nr:hypothetical protein [Streptomyces sp. NBC_01422]